MSPRKKEEGKARKAKAKAAADDEKAAEASRARVAELRRLQQIQRPSTRHVISQSFAA